jgi:chromosome segregation ATPase
MNQVPAGKAGASSRSGMLRAVNPAPAAAAPDAALAYGRGMMLDDNPFNSAFAGGPDAPALELERDAVEPPVEESVPPPAPVEQAPEQTRARAIVDIAKYGPRPTSPLQQPLYWFRVMSRKRALSEQLVALSAQRKRADDQAQEALVALAEGLLALRGSPELAALDKQFAAVEDAEHRVGHAAAEGQKRRQDVNQELTRLKGDLARAEAKAAPLREREAQLVARSDELKVMARRADMLTRKAEAELEAVRAKGGAEPERWTAMVAERDAHLGEFQTLGIQLQPLEEDLAEVRRGLAVHTRAISAIQDEMRSAVGLFERAEQTQRVTVGSARGARTDALISLANASLKLGLHELMPDYSEAVIASTERAEKQRQLEELQRAAVNSYDAVAYTRGFNMLLGSSLLLFVSLALAILF